MKIDIINIVDLLRIADWYGGSDVIEIAKGKNQVATTFRQLKRKLRRIRK